MSEQSRTDDLVTIDVAFVRMHFMRGFRAFFAPFRAAIAAVVANATPDRTRRARDLRR